MRIIQKDGSGNCWHVGIKRGTEGLKKCIIMENGIVFLRSSCEGSKVQTTLDACEFIWEINHTIDADKIVNYLG